MNTNQKNRIREQVLESPSNLAAFLGFDNNWHHLEWYTYYADNKPRIVILAPREHAKSTVFTVICLLWSILKDPNVRIIIVSSTSTQAEGFLRQATSIIENHVAFNWLFGNIKPDKPEKWTDSQIIVKRNTHEKDPTVSAVGTGGPILSKRADVIICDDILSLDNTKTLDQRAKTKLWFNTVLYPVLVKGGRLISVATAFNKDDLSHDLMKNPLYDVKKIYRMIIEDADRQDLWDEYIHIIRSNPLDGKELGNKFYEENKEEMIKGAITLWPDRYDYKDAIDKKLEIGTRSFNLAYQNNVIDDDNAVFKESWIEKAKDTTKSFITNYDPAVDTLGIRAIAQGMDLASEDEESNLNVIATVGLLSDNRLMLLNVEMGHWTQGKMRENIREQNSRFNPSIFLIESNAMQKVLVKDFKEMEGGSLIPIEGFTTTQEKFDENIGINAMAVTFENERWILPANQLDQKTSTVYDQLKDEMLDFPSGHTGDILMAVWFAWSGLRKAVGADPKKAQVSGTGLKRKVVL